MSTPTMIKIPLNKAAPNMILAQDILYGKDILIAKDTMLNNRILSRLHHYSLPFIYVKQSAGMDATVSLLLDENAKPDPPAHLITTEIRPSREIDITKMNAFDNVLLLDELKLQAFQASYDEKTEKFEHIVADIGNGKQMKIEDLFQFSTEIIGVLENKSDLFLYLSQLHTVDEYTFSHSMNVSLLCSLFANWLALSDEEVMNLTVAGVLHDIGKTQIDPKIINKTAKLNNQEFEIMKQHTVMGYKMIADQNIPDEIKKTALLHHEKMDGTGYPGHVKGDDIGYYSRIVAIADIFDAMTSNRSYRKKICPFDVIHHLETNYFGEIDPELLLMFIKNIAYSYLGSYVELSNGQKAEVIKINADDLARPMVKTENRVVDLSATPDWSVKKIL